jgi:ABC-type branched-subunit amino acid transport system substrate-binding protein
MAAGQSNHGTLSAAGSTSTANCASAPGVSSTEIKIGVLGTTTGAAAATLGGFTPGVTAGVDVINAAGGINGRKITLSYGDNASDPSKALPAVQTMVQQDNVFLLLNGAVQATPIFPWTLAQGIPILSYGGTDPLAVTQKNVFAASGVNSPTVAPSVYAKFFKSHGVKKVAVVGTNTPGSITAAQAQIQLFQKVGLKVVFTDFSLTSAAFDGTSEALKIKDSGAQALYMPTANTPFVSVNTALKAQNVPIKVAIGASVYSTSLLKNPTMDQAYGINFFVPFIGPTTSLSPAAQQMVSDMAKYAPGTGLDQFSVGGYLTAQLLAHALTVAGACPTQAGLISKLRKGSFTSPLLAQKITKFTPGPTPNGSIQFTCAYFAQINGGAFVSDSKATCSKPVKVQAF